MLKLKDIGADNHYFIHGYYFQIFFHMLALCNFLLWVNKKKACIIYNYKLSITPYPIVFQRFQMSFFIYYITLKSIYNFLSPYFLNALSFVRTYIAAPTYHFIPGCNTIKVQITFILLFGGMGANGGGGGDSISTFAGTEGVGVGCAFRLRLPLPPI